MCAEIIKIAVAKGIKLMEKGHYKKVGRLTIIGCSMLFLMHCKKPTAVNDQVTGTLEQHRPQLHFTPPAGWMNDPNGMVYFDGEYHLFYQHYPDSTVWGPMHWGHAVSKDMMAWEHLPMALYPDTLGYIFSGSAVVDWNNTSGLSVNGQPVLVAMFTHHLMEGEKAGRTDYQVQSIAFSLDKGRTWAKYSGNPVIKNPGIKDWRDPKVIWHEPTKKWIVAIAAYDHLMIYSSPNLMDWTHESNFGRDAGTHAGVWECPDLFPLTVEQTDETKWVLIQNINPGGPFGGSGTMYFVGDFDGHTFTLDPTCRAQLQKDSVLWMDYGKDNYAGVTWSDVPASDGRKLLLGWMGNWQYAQMVPTGNWRSAMTLPRELTLVRDEDGYRLCSKPAKEILAYRLDTLQPDIIQIVDTANVTYRSGIQGPLLEVELTLDIPEGEQPLVGIELSNDRGEFYRIGYDASTNSYFSDRSRSGKTDFSPHFAAKMQMAPRFINDRIVKMHIIFDVASAELFADNGRSVMTEIFFPNEDFTTVKLFSKNGSVKVPHVVFYHLKKSTSSN